MEETDAIERMFLSALKSINPARGCSLQSPAVADSMAMLSLCMEFLPPLQYHLL